MKVWFVCFSLLVTVSLCGLTGCEQRTAKKKTAPPSPPVVTESTPPPEATSSDAPPVESTPTETVKAEVGVGQKGRSLDEYSGPLVTPAKAFFSVREKVAFEIQIPSAMQFYKAEHGNAPKTHDEFMDKIITANNIKLPELPAGHTYQYNPEKEELEVVRPAKP